MPLSNTFFPQNISANTSVNASIVIPSPKQDKPIEIGSGSNIVCKGVEIPELNPVVEVFEQKTITAPETEILAKKDAFFRNFF